MNRWRVTDDFSIDRCPTLPERVLHKKEARERLKATVSQIASLQQDLFAEDRQALLLIFQAMDAAGKDGTIRKLLSGVNPAGCQFASFKRPSDDELDHDFLWRHVRKLPERGRLGVHNRSWYEEVLVVRVNPGILHGGQRLHERLRGPDVWTGRLRSIREFEGHLVRNGTSVVKFFLNVSRQEQARRLVARIDDPARRWKFEAGDLDVRERWADYMAAYQEAMRATSTDDAPWYAIPADHKWTMRVLVAQVVLQHLQALAPRVPSPADVDWDDCRQRLLR